MRVVRTRRNAWFISTFVTTLLVATSFLASSGIPAKAAQTIPYKINFQGRLTDNNGNILPDGSYNIKFRIMDALSGGTNVWQGDRIYGASDHRVQISNGLFNIQFGETSQGDPALSPTLFSGTFPLYLEVELPTPATATCNTNGCASFTEGAMTPRQALASAPYAFNSDTLDGLDSSIFGQLGQSQTWTGTNTFQPTTNISSAIVKQNSSGSFGADVFAVQGSSSGNFIQVTSTAANAGAVTIQSLGSNNLTLQGGSGTVTLGSSTNLTSTGALAIGTGSGDLTLDPNGNTLIKGSTSITGTAALDVQNSTSSILYVRNDGNIGIGTSTPGNKLTVKDGYVELDNSTLSTVAPEIHFKSYNGRSSDKLSWVMGIDVASPTPSRDFIIGKAVSSGISDDFYGNYRGDTLVSSWAFGQAPADNAYKLSVVSGVTGGSTTIAAGSNGVSLPQATINVASTAGFASSGYVLVTTSAGAQWVSYTGITGTSFTGASGGTGTMSTGGAVGDVAMGGLKVQIAGTTTGNALTLKDGSQDRLLVDNNFWLKGQGNVSGASVQIKADATNARTLALGMTDGTGIFGFEYNTGSYIRFKSISTATNIAQFGGDGSTYLYGPTTLGAGGELQGGNLTIQDNRHLVLGTSTGTMIGTATNQKLGFYGATPIVQPTNTTDLRQSLINLGLYAPGGATPLDLNGGALTAGSVTTSGNQTFSGTIARTITGPTTGGLTVGVTSGPLTLSTTTSGTLSVSSAGVLNLTGSAPSTWDIGNNTLSIQTTSNGAITTGSGLLTQGGNITFSGTTARTITGPATGGLTATVASGPLTFSTTTSGTLAATSAGALNLSGALASGLTTAAGNLTLQGGSGTVTLGTSTNLTAAGALTLGTGSGDLTLDPTGNTIIKGSTSATGSAALDIQNTTASILYARNDGNIGIGTASPNDFKLQVAGSIGPDTDGTRDLGSPSKRFADLYANNVIEKSVIFTPTTGGWYRIAIGNNMMGGTIRISAPLYDSTLTDIEFQYSVSGFALPGSIQQTRYSSFNNGAVSAVRTSSDGAATLYLDIFVSTATAPQPITIFGYGPNQPAFVASPVVGAAAGSSSVNFLTLGPGFRSTQGANFAETSGNVGIGLSGAASQLLSVGGTTGNFTVDASSNVTTGGNQTFSGTTARIITGPSTGGLTTTVTGGPLTLSTTTSGTLAVTSAGALNLTGATASGFSTSSGNLTLQGGSGTVTLGTSTNLTATGAITLGTGSGDLTIDPTGNTIVKGSTSVTGTAALDLQNSTGSILYARNDGNIGIGTTSPGAVLHVSSSVISNALLKVTDATATAADVFTIADEGAVTFQNRTNSTSAFSVQTAAGNKLINVDTTANNTNNLVTNPSIESAISGNWVLKGSATVTQDATDAYYGSNSLRIQTSATANDGAKQVVSLTSATTYTMSLYARSSAGNMSTFEIGRSENGSTDTACLVAQTVVKGGWTRFSCTFLTGTVSGSPYIYVKQTDAVARSYINIDSVILQTEANHTPAYKEGQIALQGAVITPLIIQNTSNTTTALQILTSKGANILNVDTTDSNILAGNAGFEVNSSGWSYNGTPGSVIRDSSQAYTDSYSLKVVTTVNANNGAKFTLANGSPATPSLATSTQYTLSWYAKLDAASAAFTDEVAGYSPDGGAETACTPSNQTVVSGGWTRYSCTFNTPVTATNASAYLIIKQTGATAHTFYLDSVQLELGANATAYGAGNLNFNATITSAVVMRTASNSTTAFQVQNAAGSANIFSVDTLNEKILVGGTVPTLSSLAGLTVSSTGSNTLTIQGGNNTVTIGGTAPTLQSSAGQALTLTANAASTWSTSSGQLTIQSGSGTLSFGSTTNLTANGAITLNTGTNSALTIAANGNGNTNFAATGTGTLTIGSTSLANHIIAGPAATTSTAGVVVGATAQDSTQVNLVLDNSSNFTDGGTCSTTVNAGAIYYNTGSSAVRACVNGSWEDLVTTQGLGIIAFGVVVDSGSQPGDLQSLVGGSGVASGPCQPYWKSATAIAWTGCIAYSGGRKVVIAANSTGLTTTNSVAGQFQHLCLTGASGQPALSTAGTEVANLPAWNANNPIVCLADVKFAGANNTITNLYDTRVFSNVSKQFVNTTVGMGLDYIAISNNNQVTTTTTASNPLEGVIVASNGAAWAVGSGGANAIMVTNGAAFVKTTAALTTGRLVTTTTTAGYATSIANPGTQSVTCNNGLGANACNGNPAFGAYTLYAPYVFLGINRTTSAAASACSATVFTCGSALVDVKIR